VSAFTPSSPALSSRAASPKCARGFAIDTLKRLRTKSLAQFARTRHSDDDLGKVEDFIRDVRSDVVVKRVVGHASATEE
jgi:hypothetical protein